MVWSVNPHKDFPDETIEVHDRSDKQCKIIRKNNRAITCLRASFVDKSDVIKFITSTIDAMPDNQDPTTFVCKYPNGRIHLILKKQYKKYRGRSFLDRLRLDKDKETIVISEDKHPDMLYMRAALVEQKYFYQGVKPTYDELVGRVVHGATEYY